MSAWFHWHHRYADPDSEMGRRLAAVQGFVRRVLDGAPPGPFVILDICGGQGQAVISVLASHSRAADVTAYDVELDPDNVAAARTDAARAGLTRFQAIEADAGLSDSYAGLQPADLVIMAGVLRHMTRRDSRRFIAALPQLCAPEAWVLWTRREDARARRIRARFDAVGFNILEIRPGPGILSFTLARMECAPEPRQPGVRWFTFRPMGVRWPRLHRVRVRAGSAVARLRGRTD